MPHHEWGISVSKLTLYLNLRKNSCQQLCINIVTNSVTILHC